MLDFEESYNSRFAWRIPRQIFNYKELAEITGNHSVDPIDSFQPLFQPYGETKLDAFKHSILMLTYEASECYIFGEFQTCILTCGAIVERILKLEYLLKNEKMPDKKFWPLGRCLIYLDFSGTRISTEMVEIAKGILSPRNSRAHALLESDAPLISVMGGIDRGIEEMNSGHYLIEPYRGDARMAIDIVYKLLIKLYYENEQ